MQPKLIVSFDRLSGPNFLAKARGIVVALSSNGNFPEPWPAPTPSLATVSSSLAAYQDAFHAAQTHDSIKIQLRDAARNALTALLKTLGAYLELAAQGDVTKLAGTGFDLRHDAGASSSSGPLPAPDGVQVSHGAKSGSVDVSAAKVPGARSYEVQLCQGDPTVAANWHHAITRPTDRHISIENLIPAQTYWFRLRAIGTDDEGVWSAAVSIIVV